MRKAILAVLAAALAGSFLTDLVACSSTPQPVKPTTTQISDVSDSTGSPYYTVESPVDAVTDQFGTHVVLHFAISNANNIVFNPKVTLTFADGGTVTCQEEDLRRLPSLVASTTTWPFPCDGAFPADFTGTRADIVDTYH